MSAELVLVAPGDRPAALATYRALLARRAADDIRDAMHALGDTVRAVADGIARIWPHVRDALASIWDAFRRTFGYRASRAARYAACQTHYGVRRVTARQYRAWKRQEGRR